MTFFKRGNSSDDADRRGSPAPSRALETRASAGSPPSPPAGQPPPPPAPLGWYADPENPAALRFWNGDEWDAPDGAAAMAGLSVQPTPETLCSPTEAGRLGDAGSDERTSWARTSRACLAAAAVAAAGTAGALLAQATAPADCLEPTAVLGAATTPEDPRLTECTQPDVPTQHLGADPEGPHGPYPPVSARCHALDPGV